MDFKHGLLRLDCQTYVCSEHLTVCLELLVDIRKQIFVRATEDMSDKQLVSHKVELTAVFKD